MHVHSLVIPVVVVVSIMYCMYVCSYVCTVHFIKKFTFHDHGTIMITSYYETYYGVITI